MIQWIKNHFQRENWFNHFIVFLTTITGILIALSLDNVREAKNDGEKLDMFRIRLNNELITNKLSLINFKQNLMRSYALINLTIGREPTPGRIYTIPRQVIDSLIAIDDNFKSIITVSSEDETSIKASLTISFFPLTISSNVWESMKASNILQQLRPQELVTYSITYQQLNTSGFASINDFYKMLSEFPEDGYSEDEKNRILEVFQMLIIEAYGKEMSIEKCLGDVEMILKNKEDIFIGLKESKDSTKLNSTILKSFGL